MVHERQVPLSVAADAVLDALRMRRGRIVLDRETCDWVIDNTADTAICRTHGEVVDGPKSKHFPGAHLTQSVANDSM